MGESLVQVTEGTGKKLHTNSYVVGANTVEDEYTVPGEYPLPTYSVAPVASNSNVANDHFLQIMAGATNKVRIRRIRLEQGANATAAIAVTFQLFRLTTAGTGGTVYTPRPYDSSAVAAGATAMVIPAVKGTEGVMLLSTTLVLRQAISATGAQPDDFYEWVQLPNAQPIIIPAGIANGVAIKNTAAFGAAGSVIAHVEFVETSY